MIDRSAWNLGDFPRVPEWPNVDWVIAITGRAKPEGHSLVQCIPADAISAGTVTGGKF
jgi:hypothetical protein